MNIRSKAKGMCAISSSVYKEEMITKDPLTEARPPQPGKITHTHTYHAHHTHMHTPAPPPPPTTHALFKKPEDKDRLPPGPDSGKELVIVDPQDPDGWTQTEISLVCAQGPPPR